MLMFGLNGSDSGPSEGGGWPPEASNRDGFDDDASRPWPSHTIILLEPDAVVAQALLMALTAQGYRAHSAKDFDSAKALVVIVRPELVILDIVAFSDFKLDLHLRDPKSNAVVPVLVLSGIAVDEKTRRMLNRIGASGCLVTRSKINSCLS